MSSERPRHNGVLLTLSLAGLLLWLALDTVSVAPNRIVPGTAHGLVASLGWGGALASALPLLALAGLARRPTPAALRLALGLTVVQLAALPLWLSLATQRLVDPGMAGARLGVGAGVWLLLFLLLMLLVELRSRLALSRLAGVALLAPPVAALWLSLAQWLSPLALWQEALGRRDQFLDAVLEHLALVGVAVGVSLVLGVAAALAMRRWQAAERIGFGVLNVLQTIPSIALFGLLLAPLAWLAARVDCLAALGVSGIGWAPALLALVGYSLLPMVRNTFVALAAVDPGVIDAARGMGMSRGQVFRQVRLPLALPVILEGVRITTVQAIGLTAVAALIGAGGLGTFIFQGLGQAAMDLVLLGALPILVLALAADALLGALTDTLRPGGAE
ncbi:Putative osmoprotectant uptake system permease protein YehY [Halomonas sp. THAF5a]|uniref:ABC transporter permease n=1 Tax=Halomonas sp. THAF5a TaxID=2587844 RepID=UPI0012AA3892|nr:ABC transporter permease [Halomonas sp. THAF5a]QFU01559.1 Putative osmoprotectant uptake system permease protein YehY [Halomonas sp. THAF5a]